MDLERNPLPTLSLLPDGHLVNANASLCAIAGLNPSHVAGSRLERVLLAAEGSPSLERFMGSLLSTGQGRFDGYLLGGVQRQRVTAWGWKPDTTQEEFWVHVVPAPAVRAQSSPSVPVAAPDPFAHLPPTFRAVLARPAKVDQLLREGATGSVLARELLADLHNLSGLAGGMPSLKPAMAGLVRVAVAISEHAELVSELTGTAGDLAPEPVPLQALLESTAALVRGALPETIDVHVDVDEGVPDALCNPLALQQALLALCANARDAMPVGGHILLSAHAAEEPGRVTLRIKDTGGGIPAARPDEAFSTTFTTREARGGARRGLGLGLPLVRDLMDRMGGTAHVEASTTVGTSIVLELPAISNANNRTGSGPRARILLVDDDPQLRRITARLLEQSGILPTPVQDGAEALQALAGAPGWAAILLDLNMPRADGRDVLQFMRVMENPPPVVVFTSEDPASVREELMGMGAHAVIGKPFRGQELVDAVRSAIAAGRAASGQG